MPALPAVPVVDAYVALGSNQAHPPLQLARAVAALGHLPDTRLEALSSVWVTAPVGEVPQPDFLNAVARLSTGLSAPQLLEACLRIEREQGRVRTRHHGPRTLDLDLLLHGDARFDEPRLQLPHPRMLERAFVMVPLAELAPGLRVGGAPPAARLAARLRAGQRIERHPHPLPILTGNPGA